MSRFDRQDVPLTRDERAYAAMICDIAASLMANGHAANYGEIAMVIANDASDPNVPRWTDENGRTWLDDRVFDLAVRAYKRACSTRPPNRGVFHYRNEAEAAALILSGELEDR